MPNVELDSKVNVANILLENQNNDTELVKVNAHQNETKVGVQRDERGRWLKGFAPTPPPSPRKRKDRDAERKMLAALDKVIDADRAAELLEMCISWAIDYKSPKTMMEVLRFRYAYGIGTPIQRSVSATTKLDDFIDRLDEVSEEDIDKVIETEYTKSA